MNILSIFIIIHLKAYGRRKLLINKKKEENISNMKLKSMHAFLFFILFTQ